MKLPNKPKVSVIIPAKNMADKIEKCLEVIFSQTYQPYEVIIIDGGSTDDTLEKTKNFPVTVIHQDYGWAGAARQLGLEAAQGEFIAFTDADCIPPCNWVEGLLAEFEEGIVGVGGGIKNIGEGLWIQSINLAFDTFLGSGNSIQARLFKEKRFEKGINTSNSMYRRRDLVEAGGFNIHLSGADEAELGRRMVKLGKLLYTPTVLMLHDHKRGLRKFAKQMFYYGRWRRECRVVELPVVPPLLVPLLLLSLIFTRWLLPSVLGLYLIMVLLFGTRFVLQQREPKYFFSIPVVYITEHLFFIVGFWREVLFPRKKNL
ncbi:glycosyltransferase [Chloroflexota bacterium]